MHKEKSAKTPKTLAREYLGVFALMGLFGFGKGSLFREKPAFRKLLKQQYKFEKYF